jgi:hypothetical protein
MLKRISLIAALCGVICLTSAMQFRGPSVTPQPIGPYALLSGPDAMTVFWNPTATLVKYGALNRLDSTVAASGQNQARLSGLRPGAVYHYEIPAVGQGSFVTPPAKGPLGMSRYSFVVLGDSRGDSPTYREVAAAIASANPSFVVHAGNIVADGGNVDQWTSFFNISREYLRSAAFFPAMGSSDSNARSWHRYFDRAAAYYSFDWGSSHWAILNSVAPPPDAESYWKNQLTWLERDLADHAGADYLFVVIHTPPFTAVAENKAESSAVAARVVPLIEKYKVSAVFSAHDDNYQRHVSGGIAYIVSAGAGEPLRDAGAPIPGVTLKAEKTDCYILAKAQGAVVALEARAASGRVIDRFEIPARKQ